VWYVGGISRASSCGREKYEGETMARIFLKILTLILLIVFVVWGDRVCASERRGAFALGVGAGLGVGKHLEVDGGSDVSFINVASVRARAFWIIGVDYEFNLGRDRQLSGYHEYRELNYHAKMRLSTLLYSFSFANTAFYLRGGVGAAKLGELFSLDAPGASYHGGFGIEFDLDEHVMFDVSFTLVLPGVHSLTERAVIDLEVPKLFNLFSLRNHELVLRLMLFL
jgi:hypothetical protein